MSFYESWPAISPDDAARPRPNSVAGIRRPSFDRDHSTTLGLSRDQARVLVLAADRDRGVQGNGPRH